MKYFINTSILFLLSTTFLQAQEVNGTDLKNLSATYIAAEYQPKTLLSWIMHKSCGEDKK